MKSLKDLNELRSETFNKLTAINDAAFAEKRDLTDSELESKRSLLDELKSIDKQIGIAKEEEDLALRSALLANPVHVGKEGNTSGEQKELRDLKSFNLVRAIQLHADGQVLDGIEGEVAQEGIKSARANSIPTSSNAFYIPAEYLQKRGQSVTGQTTTAGDQGGVLVPTDTMPLLDALWSETWMSKVGARFLTGLVGNPRFPVQKTKPTVSELTEIQEMGYTEILFSDFTMSPKRRGATIPISRQSMIQASIDVQALVIENISLALAQHMNVEAVGIVLGAILAGNNNILDLGANGRVPTYEDLVDLETLIDTKDANSTVLHYLTNNKIKGLFKKKQIFEGTTGDPIWGKDNLLNGYPAIASNLIPGNLAAGTSGTVASPIIAGNFKDLYVGLWGGVEFIVDEYAKKRSAEIEITANTFYDIKVARSESFAGIKNALAKPVTP